MILVISLFLALIPLLGIVYIVVFGSLTTVDGLFMSLILLSISGILGLNVLIELRKGKAAFSPKRSILPTRSAGPVSDGSRIKTRGLVKEVVFFESNVGQPNKSIVTLADGGGSSQTLALEGDMRNALPVGQTLEITLRKEAGKNVLVDVNNA
ncbi:MAG TPA: hypothetical protein VNZ03_04615 [Terriglobales bacterium]|jgi:hypothetical protein|nr:hypothetical protein [Terriglobales bacterium]